MKRYRIAVGGRTFDVRLLSDPRREQVQVEVDGQAFTVEVQAVLPAEPEAMAAPASVPPAARPVEAAAPGAGTLVAPLPGTVKSVAVRPGQQVARGEELLVIEAMKMDNVIRAPQEGVIARVYVAESQRVAHGEPLLSYRG